MKNSIFCAVTERVGYKKDMEFLRGYMKKNSGMKRVKPLSANSTKWSNTLKKFVGCCQQIV